MALSTKITLPKLGESILSATVVKWLKKPGEHVRLDEPIVEVATDKVNSEIPSPYEGILQEILADEGQELNVGMPLASIDTDAAPIVPQATEAKPIETAKRCAHTTNTYLSPAVLRVLKEHNLSVTSIQHLKGTGEEGRITKKDIEHYLQNKTTQAKPAQDIIPFTPMRSAIASHMMKSNQEIPAATLVTEIDVTNLLVKIQGEKARFREQHGVKLTLTCYFVEAVVSAAIQYPYMNAQYTPEGIRLNSHVHLGIAAHVEEGLVVPVLQKADTLPFAKKALGLQELKQRAQSKKLEHKDLEGATITLTNFGMSGIELGIPIIPHGQTAILGVGSVQKKVVALENNAIGVRDRMTVSLSFDHRVIDGIYGCDFLNAIKHHIEKF